MKKKIVSQFYEPIPCSMETLKEAHSEKYILDIKNKSLSEKEIKKIDFLLMIVLLKDHLLQLVEQF